MLFSGIEGNSGLTRLCLLFANGTIKFQPSYNMPSRDRYCVAKLDKKRLLLIGGESGDNHLKTTYEFDLAYKNSFKSPRSPMNIARSWFGCSSFVSERHGGRKVIVAGGGFDKNNYNLRKVELLDTTTGIWEESKFINK